MASKKESGGNTLRQITSIGAASGASARSSASHSAPRALLTSAQAGFEVFGVSERKFHQLRQEPWFPQPVVLGPRLVRWVRSELEAAVANMPRNPAPEEPASLQRARADANKAGGKEG